jgi:hypothetical protein
MINIYELAEQSAEHAVLNPSNEILQSETEDSKVEVPKAFIDKFAELIVRECAGLCSTHEMADEPFGKKSYRKGRHFDVLIRQHFGVEE